MTSTLLVIEQAEKFLAEQRRAHPVMLYLMRLGSDASRVGALSGLRQVVLELRPELVAGNEDQVKALSFAVFDTFDWRLSREDVLEVKVKLQKSRKPASVKTILAHIRGVLKEAGRLKDQPYDVYSRSDAMDATDDVKVKGGTGNYGRALTIGEISALAQTCKADETAAGIRDGAMVGIMVVGGLRIQEVSSAEVKDYDADRKIVKIVLGKGGKTRTVPIRNGAVTVLEAWLELRGSDPGRLFVPISRAGNIHRQRNGKDLGMSTPAIRNMLDKRRQQAGVASFSPHDLRRTCASYLDGAGVKLTTIRDILGHASTVTTEKYLDLAHAEANKEKAAERLHFPW